MKNKINISRACCTLVILFFAMPVLAWDTAQQSIDTYTQWYHESAANSSTNTFKYTDNGSSEVRLSLKPPTEGSQEGKVMSPGKWTYLDGKILVRGAITKKADNTTLMRFEIGGDGRDNKSGLYKGTFYVWYGKQAMATVTYNMFYSPFPIVTAPSSVIDLGTCHKSVKGEILSQPVSVDVKIYGYLNGGNYELTRKINFSNLPVGADFIDGSGQTISDGELVTLDASIPEPYFSITDNINARLNCDQASIGVQSWTANIVYTIQ
ncbi:hypothetical protein [Enterobacter quasiroggenkampii]|uniref:hypothetical protein n=1 Tax=Enterobacter quasiroggenkampii TaxID=2497436 RepID=UPI0021CFBB81|nr:hypothetical protein [Enterobacter quasiroggenkampii]MCU6359051.1 hypothetical protein [Enterobacter quasiroggenkampii]